MKTKASRALIAVVPAILLSGCAAATNENSASDSQITSAVLSSDVSDVSNVPDASEDTSKDTTEVSEERKDTSDTSVVSEESKTELNDGSTIGLNGERIHGEPAELPPEYGTGYRYTDFGYVAVSDGAVKTVTADEIYDTNIGTPDLQYSHTELGTQFGPLTLSQINCVLEYDADQKPHLFYQWLTFTGDITLKGWMIVLGDDAEGYLYPGDIYFYPGDGEWNGLPMTADEPTAFFLGSDTALITNAPTLYLGTRENYSLSELDSISSDTMYEVEITVSDPCIRYDVSKGAYSSFINPATLKEISSFKEYQE